MSGKHRAISRPGAVPPTFSSSPRHLLFVNRWQTAFTCEGTAKSKCAIDPDCWERFLAVRELRQIGELDFIQPTDDLKELADVFVFRRVHREIELYEQAANEGVQRNWETTETLRVLNTAARRFIRAAKTTNAADLKNIFSKLSRAVSEERANLQESHKSYWERALLAWQVEGEEEEWYVDVSSDEKTPEPRRPQEPNEEEAIFGKVRFPTTLVKNADLDRRFQLRVAMILRRYLLDASLQTVSRLVVLCYLCGNLVTVESGKAYIPLSKANPSGKRELTVGAVYQKLKDEPALRRQRKKRTAKVGRSLGKAKKAK